jgi:hypothetical protein
MSREADLERLPAGVRDAARINPNGEVEWPLAIARSAVDALAQLGFVVLGLDLREYDDDGGFVEVAWSVYDGKDAETARKAARTALQRDNLTGFDIHRTTVLVRWE